MKQHSYNGFNNPYYGENWIIVAPYVENKVWIQWIHHRMGGQAKWNDFVGTRKEGAKWLKKLLCAHGGRAL